MIWDVKRELVEPAFAADVDTIPGDWAVTYGFRTAEQQNKLYAQGRTAPGEIVTNAPAGHSPHEFGLAVDIARVDFEGTRRWDYAHPQWDLLWQYVDKHPRMHGGWHFPSPDQDHVQAVAWARKRQELRSQGLW